MRNVLCSGVLSMVAAVGCAAGGGAAPERLSATLQDPAEMEAAWMKAATPGPHHEHLKPLIGTWDVKAVIVMEPGAPASESTATMAYRPILGGRYLVQDYSGSMMNMPFDGLGLWGYDNVAKRYQNVWCDSMGTMMMIGAGSCSEDGKTITIHAEFTDFMGAVHKPRMVTRITDANTHVFEMFEAGKDGKDFKLIELTCTRRAEAKADGAK